MMAEDLIGLWGASDVEDQASRAISDEMPFVVAASPSYLERHGTPAAPDELIERFRAPAFVCRCSGMTDELTGTVELRKCLAAKSS